MVRIIDGPVVSIAGLRFSGPMVWIIDGSVISITGLRLTGTVIRVIDCPVVRRARSRRPVLFLRPHNRLLVGIGSVAIVSGIVSVLIISIA